MLLGSSVAARVGARLGDTIRLSVVLTVGPTLLPDEALGRYDLVVRGIAGGAFGAHDSVFVDRAFLAAESGMPRGASAVLVYADNHEAHAGCALARRIGRAHPEVRARCWVDDSSYLGSAVDSVAALSAVSQTMVILAVAIPVLALLYIRTLHRRRQVGILRAMGLSRSGVFRIVLCEALLVALAGGVLGALLGAALIRYFQLHPIYEHEGFIIYPRLALECFVRPLAVVLAATVLAGLYPAWRASLVEPARVLRGVD